MQEPFPSSHVWAPIGDLTPDDLEAKSDELPRLALVWREERETLSREQDLKRFNERLQREWAIETGIIERLYSLDRAITQLLIERGIDASLIPPEATDKPPALVVDIIEDQEAAVDFLFDLVAQRRPLSVGFIKELHALMTRHQETVVGRDQFGRTVATPLERGAFKRWANNPTRTYADGSLHEYCPPEHVDAEMDRLLELHLRHVEDDVPPEIEAAWLHHRFTQIHPFQDGNGRVARALASLVFISCEWFPLVITRDDRTQYLDALEKADKNGLGSLVELFVSRQRRAFVGSLGIAREVTQEGERLDQQLAAIADLFSRRDMELRQELDRAKEIARSVWSLSVERFEDLAGQLKQSMSAQGGNRNAFVDSASDHGERKTWHRWQIIQAARDLSYFASLRDFACWTVLKIDTESGRGEILLSFHEVGPEFRGVIGASVAFYRRQEVADGQRHAVDHQTVSGDMFQINYKDSEDEVKNRFQWWLDRSLVRALDAWRRGE